MGKIKLIVSSLILFLLLCLDFTDGHSQDYNNNVAIWKYWVKANNQVSDTIYACRLGLEDVEATYGDTSIPTPNILPENINGVSLTYSTEGYDADVAEAVNGAITIKKTGRQPIDAAFSNIPADYTFLTDEESGTPEASFSLMVMLCVTTTIAVISMTIVSGLKYSI